MTLIEGIGDEVIQFFVVVFIIVVGLLAWFSTSIADQPLVRTVLVVEMMTRQRTETNQVSNSDGEHSIDTGQSSSHTALEEESESVQSDEPTSLKANPESVSDSSNESVNNTSEAANEHSQVPNAVESNTAHEEETSVARKRIAYFEKQRSAVTSAESSSSDEVRSPSEIRNVSDDQVNVTEMVHVEEGDNSAGIIRIRLKYLNDTQKLVEGNLEEQLGEFKRRHFGLEIQTNKLVRLIFNGHVLQSDSETLQNYGLFDNCVVHCLVHNQQRPLSNNTSGNSAEAGQANGVNIREWDMDNHLFGSLSFILVAAWYCRYTYAQLFTTTTTVALVCLTGVFFVSLLGVYLPDQGRERH